jgi:hypothetical protein
MFPVQNNAIQNVSKIKSRNCVSSIATNLSTICETQISSNRVLRETRCSKHVCRDVCESFYVLTISQKAAFSSAGYMSSCTKRDEESYFPVKNYTEAKILVRNIRPVMAHDVWIPNVNQEKK